MRPTIAFRAPQGFREVQLKAKKYGNKYKEWTYRQDEPSEPEDDMELEKAIADARDKVEIELNDEQKRRMVLMAMKSEMLGSKRKRRCIDAEGNEVVEEIQGYDVSGPARMMVNGDAVTGDVLRAELSKKEREIYDLRTQLDYERRWTAQWKRARGTFHPPPKGRDRVSKRLARRAQRTLQAVDAHLYAIWCMVDEDDSLDGFMNLMSYLVGEGMPGSRCAKRRRWFNKKFISLLMCNGQVRERFEIERRKKHIWAPSAFNKADRQGHMGQRQIRSQRPFKSRQRWGNEELLRSKRGTRSDTPCLGCPAAWAMTSPPSMIPRILAIRRAPCSRQPRTPKPARICKQQRTPASRTC